MKFTKMRFTLIAVLAAAGIASAASNGAVTGISASKTTAYVDEDITITVQGIYEYWASTHTIPGTDAATLDSDSDGVKNLLEFAFGLNPAVNDNRELQRGGTFTSGSLLLTGLPIVGIEPTQYSLDYRAVFIRRRDHAAAGLIYTPEFSALLNVWQASTATPTVLATIGDYELVTVPYLPFVNGRKAQFFRIRVDVTP